MTNHETSLSDRVVQHTSTDGGFVTRRVAGETIVVPVSSRVGDLDAIFTLNEVGSRVWALLEAPRTVQEIVTVLSEEYDASSEQIARDVIELLTELRASGLVRAAVDSEG
jgi:hypothetical protein